MNAPAPVFGIARRYLHDEVADRLRELIHAGDLPPRARVNELELAERFGISRTPLREAIKILATEGLLDLLPNRGARVASVSAEEVSEMIEVVAGLEATAGELACRHASEAEIESIAALHAEMLAAYERRDNPEYFRLNREIHQAIMAASRNGTLQTLYASLSGRIQKARYEAHKTAQQWRKAVEEHEAMIVLLTARKGAEMAVLMRDHVRGKMPLILASYG